MRRQGQTPNSSTRCDLSWAPPAVSEKSIQILAQGLAPVEHPGRSRIDEGGDASSLAFLERGFAQSVREVLQIGNAVDEHRRLVRIGGAEVKLAVADQRHAQRLVQIEVVDSEQLDVLFELGQQP